MGTYLCSDCIISFACTPLSLHLVSVIFALPSLHQKTLSRVMAWCLVHWTPSLWDQVRCSRWNFVFPFILLHLSHRKFFIILTGVSKLNLHAEGSDESSPIYFLSQNLCWCAHETGIPHSWESISCSFTYSCVVNTHNHVLC